MIFLKKCFVGTTSGGDAISIVHDVRYAVRDSQVQDGLVTVSIPESGAGVVIGEAPEEEREMLSKIRSVSIPLEKGELIMSPRETITLIDVKTEGRRREFIIQVMGEGGGDGQQKRGAPPPRR